MGLVAEHEMELGEVSVGLRLVSRSHETLGKRQNETGLLKSSLG